MQILKMKTIGSILLFLWIPVLWAQDDTANADKVWTLEECIDYAWENNLNIRSSQLDQLTNEITLKQSKFDLLPNLSAGGSVGKSFGRTIDPVSNSFVSRDFMSGGVSANSNVTLYQGGRLRNTIKRNELNMQSGQYDLEKAQNDVALDVASRYLTVLLNAEQLDNSRYQLEVTQAQLEQTLILVEAGSVPYSNQLDLASQVASNEVQVVNAENNYAISVLNLKQSMQMPADFTLNIAQPDIDVSSLALTGIMKVSEVFEVAQATMPEVKSTQLIIESRGIDEKIAKAAFLPTLSLSGSLTTNYSDQARQLIGTDVVDIPATPIGFVQGTSNIVLSNPRTQQVPLFSENYSTFNQFEDNLGQSVRVNLNVPIFSKLSNTTNLQRAQINKQRAEISAENVKNQLRQNIETAHNNALASLKSYEASQKRVASLEESFRATQERYNVGQSSFVDFQIANNNLFAARTDLLRAKYEYIFRVKILDFYLGKSITLE